MIEDILHTFNYTSQEFVFMLFLGQLLIAVWGWLRGFPFFFYVLLSLLGVFFYGWLSCCDVPIEWRLFLGRALVMSCVVCISGELLLKIYYRIK